MWVSSRQAAADEGRPFNEEEPTRADVVEHQVGVDVPEQAWTNLSRVSSYPYLSVLARDNIVNPKTLGSQESQTVPVQVQGRMEKNPQALHAERSEFEGWHFLAHADEIKRLSPKFRVLEKLIAGMISDSSPDTMPDKDDPCRKRYTVVFCNNGITAALTWLYPITDEELCKKVQPILFSSGVGMDRRQNIMREMVAKGKADGRCKILVAMTEIAAEGFNLQRVNNIWFMELPTTLTRYLQAVGRAVRTGQRMRVNVARLYDEEDLLESTSLKTLLGKIAVSDLIYNVK